MAIPKRLEQMLEALSLEDLRELRDLLDQLIQQWERSSWERPQTQRAEAPRVARYTYRQEYVRCGKPGCKCAEAKGHGPYWYRYWKESGKLKKEYLGKKKPSGR